MSLFASQYKASRSPRFGQACAKLTLEMPIVKAARPAETSRDNFIFFSPKRTNQARSDKVWDEYKPESLSL
jgi:hypothetical protein